MYKQETKRSDSKVENLQNGHIVLKNLKSGIWTAFTVFNASPLSVPILNQFD